MYARTLSSVTILSVFTMLENPQRHFGHVGETRATSRTLPRSLSNAALNCSTLPSLTGRALSREGSGLLRLGAEVAGWRFILSMVATRAMNSNCLFMCLPSLSCATDTNDNRAFCCGSFAGQFVLAGYQMTFKHPPEGL